MKSLVVVPTYNERDTVADLLEAVERAAPGVGILIVDDASPDGTAGIVRADHRFGTAVFLLERDAKTGIGGAYREGFRWALTRGYDRIAQMDADLSHPAAVLPWLFAALDDADVAVGSRYVTGGRTVDWPPHRRLLSRAGNGYVRRILGLRTHDATAGFKAFRAEALRRIDVLSSTSNGYSFQIENTWRAERRGLRVVEIPIVFTDRTAGASKMSGAIVREALGRVLVWRLREIAGRLRFGLLPRSSRRRADGEVGHPAAAVRKLAHDVESASQQ